MVGLYSEATGAPKPPFWISDIARRLPRDLHIRLEWLGDRQTDRGDTRLIAKGGKGGGDVVAR